MLWKENGLLRAATDTIFETLIRYVPPAGGAGAGPGRYVPGLARAWRVAAGGREIRLELEPGVTFHDGRRFTATDVQFSLDSARDPRVPTEYLRRALADIEVVDKINERELRIRLVRPSSYVLRALAAVPILSEHVYAGQIRSVPTATTPIIGTGPYRLESFADGVVHLTRWAGYWGKAPAIADIELVHDGDAAHALIAAKRGEIDVVPAMIPGHAPEQASAPGLVTSFRSLALSPPSFRYLVLDAAAPPLDDPRVRQALALLVDRKALVRDVHDGLARAIAGPVWPGGPGDGPAPQPPGYDPALAARLLAEAGWVDGDGDGVRERDGVKLKLALLIVDRKGEDAEAVQVRREHELIADGFRRSGIAIEVRAGGEGVIDNRLSGGDFDVAFMAWDGEVDWDLAPLLETAGAENLGKVSSKRLDRALGALREAWDPAVRAVLQGELAAAIAEVTPIVPLSASEPQGLVHRRVKNAVPWNGWLVLRDLALGADDATE